MSTENTAGYFLFTKDAPKVNNPQPLQQITGVRFSVVDVDKKCDIKLLPNAVDCTGCDGFGTGCGTYDPNEKKIDCQITTQFMTKVLPDTLTAVAIGQKAKKVLVNTTHTVKDSILYVHSIVK
jgi:hypothetical protein